MVRENKNMEKVCLFYASDYHFEMISLPYINESLKKNKKVIMMTENNLNETVNKLLSNINLSKKDKEKIAEIDWENNDLNKYKQIENLNKDGKEAVVFIKGRQNYINDINRNLNNIINTKDIKVVDCYDINSIDEEVKDISKNYNEVLSTSGIEKLLKKALII